MVSSFEKERFHGYYFRQKLSSLLKGKKIHTGIILGLAQPACPSGSRKQASSEMRDEIVGNEVSFTFNNKI